jgi:putative hemolysin
MMNGRSAEDVTRRVEAGREVFTQEARTMTDKQLPFEDQFGDAEARAFCDERGWTWEVTERSNGAWAVCVDTGGRSLYVGGDTLAQTWRDAVASACEDRGEPLPWRARPDLSTVEGCLEALREEGCNVSLGAGNTPWWPAVLFRASAPSAYYGTPGEPWTLALLQEAARDVLEAEDNAD